MWGPARQASRPRPHGPRGHLVHRRPPPHLGRGGRRRPGAAAADRRSDHQHAVPEGLRGVRAPGRRWLDMEASRCDDRRTWEVRHTAELPGAPRRPGHAARRRSHGEHVLPVGPAHAWETKWLLALVYAMLTDRPNWHPSCCWTGHGCGPPSRRTPWRLSTRPGSHWTARPQRLMTKVPAVWWGEEKPRIDAYADAVENDDRELSTRAGDRRPARRGPPRRPVAPDVGANRAERVGRPGTAGRPVGRGQGLVGCPLGRPARRHAPGARVRIGDGLLPWCTPWSGAGTVRPSPTGCGSRSPAGTDKWAAGCRPRRVTYRPAADHQE
ncbi:hypothetical protein FHV95_13251 [Streptomyces coelicolor]|nr:hypothetical protein FHV91_1345 [Streptomyces coelicolor]TYP02577.1 hypothetical protein FHV98_1335 [Streptomyces coelicolor A3(2)]TYP20664.1 hypothetical protein FHV92_13522 [Streptomyces coelicolor]TYP21679.1 hypothetical protein FHV94_13352 [Streptomyces coelicolor]TYP40584.1 hypothetical protein FHV95_13251 [Streptomyces coelicolor]